MTPLQELQRQRLLAQHRHVTRLFRSMQKQWLKAPYPSLVLRQMEAMGNMLERYAKPDPAGAIRAVKRHAKKGRKS